MAMELKQQYVVGGKVFESKEAALDYMNAETIGKFLVEKGYAEEFVTFILEHLKDIKEVYADLKNKKVSRSERAQLKKEIDLVCKSDLDVPFVKEHFQNIVDSFRWPIVRLTEEEKIEQMKESFKEFVEDEEVINALIERREELLEAFNSYKPKRELPQQLRDRIDAMRAAKAANK